MRHIFSQAILSALLVLLATTPAGATEFWVDGLDGNDANDGLTVASAKRIIQAAVDLAISPGDVVNVLPGEYFGGFALDAPQSGITVRGIGEVVIRLGGSSVENVSGTLTRIETITFRRGSSFDSDRALSISVSSDVRVERCRFLDDDRAALAIGTLTSVQRLTICECLFADNPSPAGAITIGDGGSGGPVVFERCTFARNKRAITALFSFGQILVRNCAFFENESVVFDVRPIDFSFSNFFGNPIPDLTGPNFTDDPLFIDPDSRVYYVRAGSPLLDQGQDGGRIGAFGQGFHTSRDVTKDEGLSDPAQGPTAWGAWIDSNGDALTASSLVELNDQDEVILKDSVTSAAIYSPVFDTLSAFTVISSVDFAAFEDATPAADSRKIIDAVQNTPRREVRIRTHKAAEGTFSQDPSVTPPSFSAVDKHVKFERRAQFVQMELVLRNDGD